MRRFLAWTGLATLAMFCFCSIAFAQGPSWQVEVTAPTDSVIQQTMDTASVEPAMCLGVDVNHQDHVVTVWQMVPAERVGKRQTRDMISFACPQGAALAHGHFLVRDHENGPSDYDEQAIRQLPPNERPPAAVIVVANADHSVHYVAYAVRE